MIWLGGDFDEAIKNRPAKLIGPEEWRDLCKQFQKDGKTPINNGDGDGDDDDVQHLSKSEKCRISRKANALNHCMGRTAINSWCFEHKEKVGKVPSIPVIWDKAHLRIDPISVDQTQNTEGCGRPEARRISADLHKAHSDAIISGCDDSSANNMALEQVFTRTTLLKGREARGSKRKLDGTKFSFGPTQEAFDAMQKRVMESDAKVAYLSKTLSSLMTALQGQGLVDDSLTRFSGSDTSQGSEDTSMDI